MLKRILFFLVLSMGFQNLAAQDLIDCTNMLADAREAYTAGMVELVPEFLLECIQSNGMSGENRIEAYKLVINSYLFDYLPAEADSLMDSFVREFPDYRAGNSDPQEFVYLLDAHLIALGINPVSLVRILQVLSNQKGQVISAGESLQKEPGEYGNSLGFNVGANLNFPNTLEAYSLGDPARDEGTFGVLPGFIVGPRRT